MVEIALIISLIVLFLHATTWKGMIFEKIKKIIKPEGMLYKPIYGCPICMEIWWGSLIYWIFFHNSFREYVLVLFASAGMSVIYVILITLRDAALEYIKTKKIG